MASLEGQDKFSPITSKVQVGNETPTQQNNCCIICCNAPFEKGNMKLLYPSGSRASTYNTNSFHISLIFFFLFRNIMHFSHYTKRNQNNFYMFYSSH